MFADSFAFFLLNWVVGPFLRTALSWLVFFKLEEYRQSIAIIGVPRCTAMVLVWSETAGEAVNYLSPSLR